MTAKRRFHYNRRDFKAGQEFDALTETAAKILENAGKAQRQSQQYSTRVMTAETVRLESMDVEALRAMAARLGVKVHHRAGPDKLRQALKQAGI